MRTHVQAWPKITLAIVAAVVTIGLKAAPAKAAAALWISAPNWSYSAARADSPIGGIYFWGFSVGPGTFSWAAAFSNDGLGDAGYAYAQAAAGRGGRGAVLVTGFADPWASNSIDLSDTFDPSSPGSFPSSKPATDPFSSTYSVSNSGISFTESGSELSGDEELEAFVYKGSNDESAIEAELGATSDSGNTSAGDVTDLSTLIGDLSLEPLDAPVDDPTNINSITFTENQGDIAPDFSNVILVSRSVAAPEPGSFVLLAGGLVGLGLYRRRTKAT